MICMGSVVLCVSMMARSCWMLCGGSFRMSIFAVRCCFLPLGTKEETHGSGFR